MMATRITCLLALLGTGCATAKPSGYPIDFERLGDGRHVEKFWCDQRAIAAHPYATITLSRIDTSRMIDDQPGLPRGEGALWLREALVPPGSDTILSFGQPRGTARVEVAITEMSTGSAILRVLAGELGAGHAWVQVEGRVVGEPPDGLLAEFADRRRSSGDAGFRDTFGSVGPQLVHEMLRAIAKDLKLELCDAFSQGCAAADLGPAPAHPIRTQRAH